MSDNVRRFAAVRSALRKYYPQTGSKRRGRHLTTLAAMVAGSVAAGSSHLPKMAQKAPDKTKTESRVKRFSRFIQNRCITYGLIDLARQKSPRALEHRLRLVDAHHHDAVRVVGYVCPCVAPTSSTIGPCTLSQSRRRQRR